jgi:hypothetical protein
MINAIQKNVTWRAIPIAGLAGGTVFLLTNLILAPIVLDIGPALLLRYIAALLLGSDALTDSSTSVIIVGMGVHFVFSMFFALVIAIVIHRWGLSVGIIGGAILGLCFYSFNIYTLTKYAEWFFAIDSNVLLLCHILYGAVVGGVYESLDRFDLPLMAKERIHESD